MFRRRFLLSFLLLFFCSSMGHAAVYYLSPSGSDSNNGTSPSTPWRSIDRLVQGIWSLQPGDQILFQRGGTYRGQFFIPTSGTVAAPITVGAYGSGADPIISGSTAVTGWVQHSGNIWRAPLSGVVKHVFSNGQRQTLARFPNTGWLRNDQGGTNYIQDAELNHANGTWNGATVVVRSSNWCYESRTVSSFTNGTLSFPALSFNLGNYNWGYYLCNRLSQLDAPGEWFHDAASGQLYLWAPGNQNPNNLLVEASTRDRGVTINFNRQYVTINGLAFRHQKEAGVWVDGANRITVTACTFQDLYHGIRATSEHGTYTANTMLRTYATGILVYGGNNLVEDNQLTDIAMVAGLGENTWGYQGIDAAGASNVIRSNRLQNIGYSGIFVSGSNVMVERNVVRNAVAILNDGGAIHYDNVNALTVQDNVVRDLTGSLESVADGSTNYYAYTPICHGIYFGNFSIRNTIVQRNTCSNSLSAGIHVDHTMVSLNNQVKDNVLFGNQIQLSLSDYSNYNGPGATTPYHLPSFNGIYSGNTMYCMNADQVCMRQFGVYSNTPVDFGTFSNNRYFNPWNELSILIHLIPSGEQRRYTVERWQAQLGEDAGSTRSPLRLDAFGTASVLSSNLVQNGTFEANVSGWSGWPGNGSVVRDLTYLDNGALRSQLTSSSQYPEFLLRNQNQFNVQNGQWYRMRFSVQSNVHGILRAGIKGVSQFNSGNVICERSVPFDPGRRDMEFHFQSVMSDQGVAQFVHHFSQPQYWLDNVELHRVTVQPIDPTQDHLLLVNELGVPQSLALPAGCWADVLGNQLSGPIELQAYRSRVVYRITAPGCTVATTNTVGAKVLLGGAYDAATGLMRTNLRTLGLIPANQPYTSMGISVSNNGLPIAASVMQATGPEAIVDWVVLELRVNDGTFTVAERRAALVRANGDIVGADGSELIHFSTSTTGKYLVVRHRNHLSAMTAAPLQSNGQMVDFTVPGVPVYGLDAMRPEGARRALWPGDVNMDGSVIYIGDSNDRDAILILVGSSLTGTSDGYHLCDTNLDGVVKYVGSGNDRDVVLSTAGGAVLTGVRLSQVP